VSVGLGEALSVEKDPGRKSETDGLDPALGLFGAVGLNSQAQRERIFSQPKWLLGFIFIVSLGQVSKLPVISSKRTVILPLLKKPVVCCWLVYCY
jgi:hypothetical protein